MTLDELGNMKLHQIEIVEHGDQFLFTTVMRVHCGWIYRSYDKSSNMLSSNFVPLIIPISSITNENRGVFGDE